MYFLISRYFNTDQLRKYLNIFMLSCKSRMNFLISRYLNTDRLRKYLNIFRLFSKSRMDFLISRYLNTDRLRKYLNIFGVKNLKPKTQHDLQWTPKLDLGQILIWATKPKWVAEDGRVSTAATAAAPYLFIEGLLYISKYIQII